MARRMNMTHRIETYGDAPVIVYAVTVNEAVNVCAALTAWYGRARVVALGEIPTVTNVCERDADGRIHLRQVTAEEALSAR